MNSFRDALRQQRRFAALARRAVESPWLAVAGAVLIYIVALSVLRLLPDVVLGAGAALLFTALAVGAVFAAAALTRERGRADSATAALDRIRDEAAAGREAGEDAAAARRLGELEDALDSVRSGLGAARATLWDVDAETDRARPRVASGGEPPSPVALAGDPLGWAWEEQMRLRLDPPPAWAADDAAQVWALPLRRVGDRVALLTIQFDADTEAPPAAVFDDGVAYLRTFAWMHQREARATAVRHRSEQVLEVLRVLGGEIELDACAETLATAAHRLTGATGAAVALWEDDHGTLLAVTGDDGGAEPGDTFQPLESELALVARGGGMIQREYRRPSDDVLPVAAPGERWFAEPRAIAALPLRGTGQGVTGALAVWSSSQPRLNEDSLEVLHTVAPFAALQLRHARAFGSLRQHAEIDGLTLLHNRRAFDNRLAAECTHFDRYRRPAALMLLDIDRFKATNDTYGHEAGDAVLSAVGQTIQAVVRDTDFAARYGGEEFVVLLPETRLAEARDAAERLRERIERIEVPWRGGSVTVRASLGVAACPECVRQPADLVGSADAMLYKSKEAGRNRVTAAPMNGARAGSSPRRRPTD